MADLETKWMILQEKLDGETKRRREIRVPQPLGDQSGAGGYGIENSKEKPNPGGGLAPGQSGSVNAVNRAGN